MGIIIIWWYDERVRNASYDVLIAFIHLYCSIHHWKPFMSAVLSTEKDPAAPVLHLAMLNKGESGIVTGLAEALDASQSVLRLRLLELGFAVGEKVRVMAESFPQRDPMAIRVGNSTFALRRREAALIYITRL